MTDDSVDRLSITGIEVFAHHGVFDFERRDGQRFVIDLVLGVDTRPAAAGDDLKDAVDYGKVTAGVVEQATSAPVDLIETLAQRLADSVLREPRVEWVDVTVHKPDAPIEARFEDVALTIHRTNPRTNPRTTTGQRPPGPDGPVPPITRSDA